MSPWVAFAMAACLAAANAHAQDRASALDGCQNLDICLARLDRLVQPNERSVRWEDMEAVAVNLRRFGGAARSALLERARGSNPGWRNYAGALLTQWNDWSDADVPALREALRLSPGGWIARPLGTIATPAAMEALIEDLRRQGAEGQSGSVLTEMGQRALPYLQPLLEEGARSENASLLLPDRSGAQGSAFEVVAAIARETQLPMARDWAALALDERQTREKRRGALRALAAVAEAWLERAPEPPPSLAHILDEIDGAAGTNPRRYRPQAVAVVSLLGHADREIRGLAFDALAAARDPSVLAAIASRCKPTRDPFDSHAIEAVGCLTEISAFGRNGRAAGEGLLSFLRSPNGVDRASAISALGRVGYGEAADAIGAALNSADWREAYAAARSLGWLGAARWTGELRRTASTHWLGEVRDQAKLSADALEQGRRLAIGELNDPWLGLSELARPGACLSNRWTFRGQTFSPPESSPLRVRVPSGFLAASEQGERTVGLVWRGQGGHQTLYASNVFGMLPSSEGGAVVVFGLAHLGLDDGFVMRVRPDTNGWALSELLHLPGRPTGLGRIGETDIYVVWSRGYAIVFALQGVLGAAECAPGSRARS
jgi:hypothetical protein